MSKKRSATISVKLEPNLLDVVDAEVKQLMQTPTKHRVTRANAIHSLLSSYIHSDICNFQPSNFKFTYEQYVNQSNLLKIRGRNHQILKEYEKAKNMFLYAAALHLLALATLNEPLDSIIIKHLIEIVGLIQIGTGYKSLPEVRPGAKLTSTYGNA